MKPHASPINCNSYFAKELKVSANGRYDPEQPSNLDLDDLQVESQILPLGEPNTWMVVLSVDQQVSGTKNAPYDFSLILMGYFDIVEGIPKEKAEQLLLTNGSTILYAAAREILRDMTSKGPYPPLLLPTLSFFPLPKEEPPQEALLPAGSRLISLED